MIWNVEKSKQLRDCVNDSPVTPGDIATVLRQHCARNTQRRERGHSDDASYVYANMVAVSTHRGCRPPFDNRPSGESTETALHSSMPLTESVTAETHLFVVMLSRIARSSLPCSLRIAHRNTSLRLPPVYRYHHRCIQLRQSCRFQNKPTPMPIIFSVIDNMPMQ